MTPLGSNSRNNGEIQHSPGRLCTLSTRSLSQVRTPRLRQQVGSLGHLARLGPGRAPLDSAAGQRSRAEPRCRQHEVRRRVHSQAPKQRTCSLQPPSASLSLSLSLSLCVSLSLQKAGKADCHSAELRPNPGAAWTRYELCLLLPVRAAPPFCLTRQVLLGQCRDCAVGMRESRFVQAGTPFTPVQVS